MLVEFRLPDLGEGLEEAEVVAWRVARGDQVARDQALVEVQTDKATVELPSPVAGRVSHLGAPEGGLLKVGDVLVTLESEELTSPSAAPGAVPGAPRLPEGLPGATPGGRAEPTTKDDTGATRRPKAAPAVRRLAVELGVDLAAVTGSGPAGRVLAGDVREAAVTENRAPSGPPEPFSELSVASPATAGGAGAAGVSSLRGSVAATALRPGLGQLPAGRHPLRGIRRRTAEVMAQAWATIPHITGFDEIDASELVELCRRLRDEAGERAQKVKLSAFFVAACARALRAYPLVNASLDVAGGEIVVHDGCHVGVAVATDAGLVVPVVRDADRRSLVALADDVARLTERARRHVLSPAELQGGTFTISNYGSFGGRFATPIIRPPEAAIMGFGAVVSRPIVVDGTVLARPTLPLSFSADHRLIDGDLAGAFRFAVARALERPLALLV